MFSVRPRIADKEIKIEVETIPPPLTTKPFAYLLLLLQRLKYGSS